MLLPSLDMGCVGSGGFIFFPSSCTLRGCSPVPRGLGGDAGKGMVEPGRGWPWESRPSPFPGAWKIAFLLQMTVAKPASIFRGGVVSRWRGMLPARLLPAPSRCLPSLSPSLSGDSVSTSSSCSFFFFFASFSLCAPMRLHFSIPATAVPQFPRPRLRGGGVWGGATPGVLRGVGRVCSRDQPGPGRTSHLRSQNRNFLHIPGLPQPPSPPCTPLVASPGWHPRVPRVCYTHGRCLPANPSPLVQTPRGFCQPWRGGIGAARGAGGKARWHSCPRSGSAHPHCHQPLGTCRG